MKTKAAVIALTIAIAGMAVSCHRGAKVSESERGGPAVAITTTRVRAESMPEVYEAAGTVMSGVRSVLSAKAVGRVLAVTVNAGDRVTEGEVLVQIDASDIAAQSMQARAGVDEAYNALSEVEDGIAAARAGLDGAKVNLDLAEKTYSRFEKLKEEKSVSQQEYDKVKAQYDMARSEADRAIRGVMGLESKRKQVLAKIEQAQQGFRQTQIAQDYATVRAPFSGVVAQRMTEPGQMAAPGAPLLALDNDRNFRLEVQVEETFLGRMKSGDRVVVTLDSIPGRELMGLVREIVPSVDPASRTFTAKIDLPSMADIHTGMYGKAVFVRGQTRGIAVPSRSILQRGQMTGVFTIEGGTARFRLVKTGRALADGRIAVVSGLNEGDVVAVDGADELSDGRQTVVQE